MTLQKKRHLDRGNMKKHNRLYSVEIIPIRFIVHNCSSKEGAKATVEIFGKKDIKYKIRRIQ